MASACVQNGLPLLAELRPCDRVALMVLRFDSDIVFPSLLWAAVLPPYGYE